MSEITRYDGLTDDERVVVAALIEAANAYWALPQQHPSELGDFVAALHRCLDLMESRIARRHYPKGWPIKLPEAHPNETAGG